MRESATLAPAEPVGADPSEATVLAGVARRLIATVAFPFEAFGEVNRKPTWLAPLVIAVLAAMAGNTFYSWRVNPDWEQRVRASIEQHRSTTGEAMSAEQVEQQVTFAKTLGRLFIILPAIQIPAFCILVAGLYFLGLGLAFLTPPAYRKVLSVVAWGEAATRVVATLAVIAVLILSDRESLQNADPSRSKLVLADLSAFLPSGTSAVIKSLASSLNIFTIWFLILLTVGFASIGKAQSRKITSWKAGALVFGVWVAWVLTKASLALVFGY